MTDDLLAGFYRAAGHEVLDAAGATVTGGGYKYVQLGEGNAFLRLSPGEALEPVVTGWFAEFDALTALHAPGEVAWESAGSRLAGATYDPTSHYRASEVFDFFEERGLTVDLLAASYRHQVALLAERFDALDLDPAVVDRDRFVPVEKLGGFLALESPRAGALRTALHERLHRPWRHHAPHWPGAVSQRPADRRRTHDSGGDRPAEMNISGGSVDPTGASGSAR